MIPPNLWYASGEYAFRFIVVLLLIAAALETAVWILGAII